MGRGKVWTDHEVQPPRGSADRLLSLWAIHGDVQPNPFHPGRPAADHYLGHQDWHEEARLPLRDTIHLAHTQVSINDVFCSLIMNLIKFAWQHTQTRLQCFPIMPLITTHPHPQSLPSCRSLWENNTGDEHFSIMDLQKSKDQFMTCCTLKLSEEHIIGSKVHWLEVLKQDIKYQYLWVY